MAFSSSALAVAHGSARKPPELVFQLEIGLTNPGESICKGASPTQNSRTSPVARSLAAPSFVPARSDVSPCFLCVAGSIVYLGMMVGAFFWGGLADKVGRKQSLLICMSINGFFAFLSSFVQGYGFFLFCRLLSGFG